MIADNKPKQLRIEGYEHLKLTGTQWVSVEKFIKIQTRAPDDEGQIVSYYDMKGHFKFCLHEAPVGGWEEEDHQPAPCACGSSLSG